MIDDNRIKTTLYTSEKKKDIIKQKAQRLRLSISDLLCLLGSNLKIDDKLKEKMHKINEHAPDSKVKKSKEQKATISFRAKKDDLALLEEKAKKIDMSLNDYLICISLFIDIEINFKKS